MRKKLRLTLSLVVMVVMSFGLGAMTVSPAAAAVGQCQTIIGGVIDQDPCEVTVTGPGSARSTSAAKSSRTSIAATIAARSSS